MTDYLLVALLLCVVRLVLDLRGIRVMLGMMEGEIAYTGVQLEELLIEQRARDAEEEREDWR